MSDFYIKNNLHFELIYEPIVKTPVSILNMVFNAIYENKSITIAIHGKNKTKDYEWSVITFYSDKNNKVKTKSNRNITSFQIEQIEKLYIKLNKLEKNCSIEIAEKFLQNFLEYQNISLDELVSVRFKSA